MLYQPEPHKNKPWSLMGIAAVLLVTLACSLQPRTFPQPSPTRDPCAGVRGPLRTGCLAPDFNLTTFDGQVISLSKLRGNVVVINFWASWAVPCQADMTYLQAAWNEYSARGDILFVGIDYIDTDPQALAFIRKYGITYSVGPDAGTRIASAYHVTGAPETYIVGKDGILKFLKAAPFQSVDEVKAALDPLLSP